MKFIVDGTAENVMHPARFKILRYLRESKEPQFVEQIAKACDIHPRMVSHHLDVMEKAKLIESEYKLVKASGSKRGVAVRLSKVTSKVDEVLKDIAEAVS